MLKSVSLKFTDVQDPVVFPAQGVTIFVGPNNSGKSLVLRELEQDVSSHASIASKLLSDFEIVWPDDQQLSIDITNLTKKAPLGISPDHIYLGRFNPAGTLDVASLPRAGLMELMKLKRDKRWIASQFLRFFLIRLDGRTRFELTNDRPKGDLLSQAQNILMHLFKDDEARNRVSDSVYDAFGLYFTIEQLSAQNLRIRLSETKPDADEQNWNQAAREFHNRALHIKEASDGVQAFVGILCAVLSGDYRCILIDEPEAFLHPPLARKLGFQLTSKLREGGALMASTHSSDFLIGCLQASPNVRVVRLEYSHGRSKGKIVDAAILSQLFKTPLMRSANVISALFHDGVVVTESDNDRVFYSEIYYRLAEREEGCPSILFVNAQNKQTIRDIIGPLRTFGVPAAAAVDIDILKDGGADWTGWMKSARLPDALQAGLGLQRGNLKKCYADANLEMKEGGIELLHNDEKQAAIEFFDQLDRFGMFVVRNGELESWLPCLGAVGKKTDWTISALEKMGSDPTEAAYLRPTAGDVWDFMRKIVGWIKDPARKGTA